MPPLLWIFLINLQGGNLGEGYRVGYTERVAQREDLFSYDQPNIELAGGGVFLTRGRDFSGVFFPRKTRCPG